MQKRIAQQRGSQTKQGEADVESAAKVENKTHLKDEIDEILDEIDAVLECNAEEFVRSYVQKGGQ